MADSPLKVAFLHYAAPPVIGGVERVLQDQAEMLLADGVAVKVIAGRGSAFAPGIEYIEIPEIDSQFKLNHGLDQELLAGEVSDAFLAQVRLIKGELERSLADVDVCIVHNALTMHFCLALTVALDELIGTINCRFINFAHDTTWRDAVYAKWQLPQFPFDLLNKARPGVPTVTVSAVRALEFQELFGVDKDEIKVIHNGVNLHEFIGIHPTILAFFRSRQLWQREAVFFYPARITRRKAIERAIEVVDRLTKAGHDVALIAFGPVDPHNDEAQLYYQELQEQVSKASLEERVIFMNEDKLLDEPYDSYFVMRDFYHLTDALLFSSEREGFGIPLLEAGILRMPVVCSNLAVFHEIGQDLLYYLPDDLSSLDAESLMEFVRGNQSHRFNRRILAEMTMQAIYDKQLRPLIDQLLQEKAHDQD